MLLFTILVFAVDTFIVAAVQMIAFTVMCFSAKIPLKKIFPHWKLLLFLAVLVMALQMIFGGGTITGLMICCRIVSLTVLLPMLTMTSETGRLAYGITRLGLNYRAAYIITSTLNMIPAFEDEARLIMDARKLRGVRSFETGGFFSRLNEYRAIALPLMIRAMRKAQLASLAMDSRAFGAYKSRTWLLEARLGTADYLAFACGSACFAAALAANFLLNG